MRKKQIIVGVIIILILTLAVAGFFILQDRSADARVILDHNKKTYMAPSCFEESNPTNFIEDSTLKEAEELGYPPHSACTEEALGN